MKEEIVTKYKTLKELQDENIKLQIEISARETVVEELEEENKDLKLQLKHTTHCYDEVEHKKLNNCINQAKNYIKNIPEKGKNHYFEILLEILEGFKK